MNEEELAPHVEEIARVLGGKVEKEEILKELDNYLNHYRVSLETAKRSIVKNFGADPNVLRKGGSGGRKTIEELSGSEQSVDLLVKVLTVNPKQIEKDGISKTIAYGIVGDETGTVQYTLWETDRIQLKEGESVLIRNAYTKEYNGSPQLNLGNRVSIEVSAEDVPSPSLGSASDGSKERKVAELADGMNYVIVTGKIISVEKKEITISGQSKEIITGVLADDTGSVEFTAWSDVDLEKGGNVRIIGGYVKSWRGMPKLNLGDKAIIEQADRDTMPEISDVPKPRTIEDVEMAGGAMDALIYGTVVDIKEGSGLIIRCPDCRRVLQKNACRIHGKVEGVPDLRIKAVLDDGTSSINVVFGKDITEALLGMDIDEARAKAKEAMDVEVIKEVADERLLARPMSVRGMVRSDDFGPMLIAREADLLKIDVRDEGAKLLTELEGFD